MPKSGINTSTGSTWAKLGNTFANIGGSLATAYNNPNYKDDLSYQNEKQAEAFASQFGPWGMLGALTGEVSSNLVRNWGTNTAAYSRNFADDADINGTSRVGNNLLSTINNQTFGILTPFSRDIGKLEISDDIDDVSGAYAGSYAQIKNAEGQGRRTFFGAKRAKRHIKNLKQDAKLMQAESLLNAPVIASVGDTSRLLDQQNNNLYYTDRVPYVKSGAKLLSKSELEKIYASRQKSDISDDTVGIDTNVIPEGNLHAHKNNLEEINPELNEVTEKGIPVIVTDENGDYKQVAEIEKEELVLTKDLTEKIEALWKDGSDESILEAGKILAKELLENTKDNTGEMLNGDN